jgi:agmatinase
LDQKVLKSADLEFNSTEVEYMNSKVTSNIYSNAIHLLGFCFDGTACFRKGTRLGPDAIRNVSEGIEEYSPYLKKQTSDVDSFYDLGNLSIDSSLSNVDDIWRSATDSFFSAFDSLDFKEQNIKTLTLGGEHSISYAPMKKYLESFDDLVIIHLDAHADLRDGYLGHHYSHASVIRRVLDHTLPTHKLIQYGIRSGTKEEFEWMNENNTLLESRESFLKAVDSIDDSRPIYLTLDLDYFDPCFVPGTGTPEAGGEDFHSFISLVKILNEKNFVGCDVVELAPNIDQTGNSDVFATKVVRELILAMS